MRFVDFVICYLLIGCGYSICATTYNLSRDKQKGFDAWYVEVIAHSFTSIIALLAWPALLSVDTIRLMLEKKEN